MHNVMKVSVSIFSIFISFITVGFSQSEKFLNKKILAKKINEEIILDGEMTENFWINAESVSNFFQYRPRDSVSAELDTEFRIAYDDEFIYILAKMEDISDKKFVLGDLKRDFFGGSVDYISFTFDTFLDETNGYNFGLSPYNIQREALLSDGGEGSYSHSGGGGRGGISWFNINWNTKWYSGAKVHDDYWIAEFKIPFSSIRYKTGSKVWNLNSHRGNSKINEGSVWTAIPLGFSPGNLSMTGTLEFEFPLEKSSQSMVLIPYISSSGSNSKISEPPKEFDFNVGLDMKLALSSSLNLDLTFNPDFSQVEVDEQRTNLTRFELFLPEKREFFNDNADLFSNLGSRAARPMFTRRIGIVRDTVTKQYVQNPIIYGAKLSGKVNEDLRIGVLNMQTARLSSSGVPSYNYGMVVLEKNILRNSKISSFIINKQALFNNKDDVYAKDLSLNDFNRVFGVESKLQSNNTRFKSGLFYHQSLDNKNLSNSNSYGINASYEKRNYETNIYFYGVGENFNPEVGFVPRKDFIFFSPSFQYKFIPKDNSLNRHGPGIDYEFYSNDANGITDYDIDLDYNITFNSDASLTLKSNIKYTLLLHDFDPSRSEGESLDSLSDYNYSNYTFYFRSNQRKKFYFSVNGKTGEFFNGKINNIGGTISYKFPPFLNLSLSSQYNNLNFPEPYSSAEFFSLSSKINVSFSKDLFFSTYLQYNNQIDNININARFQWRFKPLSDIFLVYTDNYYAKNPLFMNIKNRSFAFKINYWLNL